MIVCTKKYGVGILKKETKRQGKQSSEIPWQFESLQKLIRMHGNYKRDV